jgi:hypothetical protein
MLQNSRRGFLCAALAAAGAKSLPGQTARGNPPAFAFAHPGLLHTRLDLARMKDGVAANRQPIRAGFEVLRNHPQSKPEYRVLGPFAEIGRNPTIHQREFDLDCNAACEPCGNRRPPHPARGGEDSPLDPLFANEISFIHTATSRRGRRLRTGGPPHNQCRLCGIGKSMRH